MKKISIRYSPEKLKEIRIAEGLSQDSLARLSELHVRTIQKYEYGECDPTVSKLEKIGKVLNVIWKI